MTGLRVLCHLPPVTDPLPAVGHPVKNKTPKIVINIGSQQNKIQQSRQKKNIPCEQKILINIQPKMLDIHNIALCMTDFNYIVHLMVK